MLVISFANANHLPAVLAVESDGCGIWLSDLQENGSLRLLAQGLKQGRGDATPAEFRVDGEVEDFELAGRGLPPGTETGDCVVDQGDQKEIATVVSQRPLRGFRRTLLDSSDGGKVFFRPGPDRNVRLLQDLYCPVCPRSRNLRYN